MKKSKTKAFSLIEAAIVLAIIGLVIGGIWVAVTAVKRELAVSRGQEIVLNMIQTARKNYSTRAASLPSISAMSASDGNIMAKLMNDPRVVYVPGDDLIKVNEMPQDPGSIYSNIWVGLASEGIGITWASIEPKTCLSLAKRMKSALAREAVPDSVYNALGITTFSVDWADASIMTYCSSAGSTTLPLIFAKW